MRIPISCFIQYAEKVGAEQALHDLQRVQDICFDVPDFSEIKQLREKSRAAFMAAKPAPHHTDECQAIKQKIQHIIDMTDFADLLPENRLPDNQ